MKITNLSCYKTYYIDIEDDNELVYEYRRDFDCSVSWERLYGDSWESILNPETIYTLNRLLEKYMETLNENV